MSDKDITMTNPATGEIAVPYGMAVWSTGIGTRPIIMDFMKQVGQVCPILHPGVKHTFFYTHLLLSSV